MSTAIGLVVAASAMAADPPAAAPSADVRAQVTEIAKLCRADAQRLCSGIASGGGRRLACLEDHQAALTSTCRDALPKAEALRQQALKQAVKQGIQPK